MEDDWQQFVRFFKGFDTGTADIRPVRRFKVKQDMFTFPKGMECWIARDGHMYTLERPYHQNPRVIQMYVKPTLDKFSARMPDFFEEMPILDGEIGGPAELGPGRKGLQA